MDKFKIGVEPNEKSFVDLLLWCLASIEENATFMQLLDYLDPKTLYARLQNTLKDVERCENVTLKHQVQRRMKFLNQLPL